MGKPNTARGHAEKRDVPSHSGSGKAARRSHKACEQTCSRDASFTSYDQKLGETLATHYIEPAIKNAKLYGYREVVHSVLSEATPLFAQSTPIGTPDIKDLTTLLLSQHAERSGGNPSQRRLVICLVDDTVVPSAYSAEIVFDEFPAAASNRSSFGYRGSLVEYAIATDGPACVFADEPLCAQMPPEIVGRILEQLLRFESQTRRINLAQ